MNTLPEIKLAILDDHQIVIDGLKLLLRGHEHFIVAAEANTAEAMLEILENTSVDILLTDIGMPGGMNGFELTRIVKNKYPEMRVLALSMSEDGMMISKMIEQAHVDGYIPKASGQQELLNAIDTILSGTQYFAVSVMEQLASYKKIVSNNEAINLTGRELEIIECMTNHLSNKQIAAQLFISERTVETHRKNIYRKTNTKGEASLIQYAREHKLL